MSSTYPTPIYPGINPDDDDGPQLNVVCIVFMCLSFVTIVLRFISRKVTRIAYGWDDWLIIIAVVLSWGYSAGVIAEVQQNFYGQHVGKTDAAHLKAWFQGLFAIAILYPIALTASKLSLLALLYRIFGVSSARVPMLVVGGFNVAWTIAAVLVGIFSCRPVEGFWNLEIKSTCIQEYHFFLANECITITLDLFVILMPVYYIAQIRRSFSQRLSIASTFALGLIVTVVSAVRLWQLVVAAQKPGFDPTFNETPAALWAVIELNTWVVVACIPALRPLISRVYIRLNSHDDLSFTLGAFTFKWRRSNQSEASSNTHKANFKKANLPIQAPNPNLVPKGTSYTTHFSGRRKPDPYDSLLAPDSANRDLEADSVELDEVSGIRVERNFEVTRPENVYRGV